MFELLGYFGVDGSGVALEFGKEGGGEFEGEFGGVEFGVGVGGFPAFEVAVDGVGGAGVQAGADVFDGGAFAEVEEFLGGLGDAFVGDSGSWHSGLVFLVGCLVWVFYGVLLWCIL